MTINPRRILDHQQRAVARAQIAAGGIKKPFPLGRRTGWAIRL
jgi:hypothetical protein